MKKSSDEKIKITDSNRNIQQKYFQDYVQADLYFQAGLHIYDCGLSRERSKILIDEWEKVKQNNPAHLYTRVQIASKEGMMSWTDFISHTNTRDNSASHTAALEFITLRTDELTDTLENIKADEIISNFVGGIPYDRALAELQFSERLGGVKYSPSAHDSMIKGGYLMPIYRMKISLLAELLFFYLPFTILLYFTGNYFLDEAGFVNKTYDSFAFTIKFNDGFSDYFFIIMSLIFYFKFGMGVIKRAFKERGIGVGISSVEITSLGKSFLDVRSEYQTLEFYRQAGKEYKKRIFISRYPRPD